MKGQISPAVAVVVIIIVLVLLYVAWQLIYGKKTETAPPIAPAGNMTLPATPDGSSATPPAAPVAPPAPPGG